MGPKPEMQTTSGENAQVLDLGLAIAADDGLRNNNNLVVRSSWNKPGRWNLSCRCHARLMS
eukprot:805205-Amphidinium_carterae.1